MSALAILFGASFTALVSLSLGARILGRDFDAGARFVIGAAALSIVVFGLGCLGAIYPAVFLVIGGAAIAWGFRPSRSAIQWRNWSVLAWMLALTAAIYFLLYFFNAMAPESSFDGSVYHLSFVGRYLREHGFHPITWNLYASLSQGAEMLYLFGYAFGQHSAASMVHFAFLLALAWQMFVYGRHAGYPVAGACGALLLFLSPMAGVDGTSAYVDVALAAVEFTLFHLLTVWEERPTTRLLIAIGLAAGFAYGVKYTGWTAVPFALAWVAWKSRRWRDPAIVAACSAVMILPWMVRNLIWTGNPLAPFFNHWFSNPYVTTAFETEYQRYFHTYGLASLWQIPMQVTTYGHLGGLLGPVFLLTPIALLSLRHRAGRRLLLAAVVFGANYFSNIGARFLIPSLPFIALAMAMALSAVPRLAVAMVLLHALLSWPTRIPRYCAPDAWHLTRVPWRQALRIKSTDEYLATNMFFYGVARMVDRSTPPDATVFTYRPFPEAYTSRRILVNYESEPNQILGVMLQAVSFPSEAPAWHVVFRFRTQDLTALRLVTRSSGRVQWRIHEVQLIQWDVILRDWTAHPSTYPWTAASAHDFNLLTFWRAADPLTPGQTFDIHLAGTQPVDCVAIDTSLDQRDVQLQLEGRDPSGRWHVLSNTPTTHEEQPNFDLRPGAIQQLRQRGIRYLLSFENEGETRDLRLHPDRWGIREVAHNKDARLYQIP